MLKKGGWWSASALATIATGVPGNMADNPKTPPKHDSKMDFTTKKNALWFSRRITITETKGSKEKTKLAFPLVSLFLGWEPKLKSD